MKLDSDEEIELEDKRNPVKRAEREKEFKAVGKIKAILTDPVQML